MAGRRRPPPLNTAATEPQRSTRCVLPAVRQTQFAPSHSNRDSRCMPKVHASRNSVTRMYCAPLLSRTGSPRSFATRAAAGSPPNMACCHAPPTHARTARRRAESTCTKSVEVVPAGTSGHHFDRTASQPEGHRPNARLSSPVNRLLDGCRHDVLFETSFNPRLSHRFALFVMIPDLFGGNYAAIFVFSVRFV